MQKIIDTNGKLRTVLSIKKVVFPIRDAITGDTFSNREYVEVVIIGKTRTWIEWYPLREFQIMNPEIKIK